MTEKFPFGKAPFWLLMLSVVLDDFDRRHAPAASRRKARSHLRDLRPPHLESCKRALPEFERKHGVKVSLQLVTGRALETRLQTPCSRAPACPTWSS